MTKTELLALSDSRIDEVVKIQGTIYDRKRKLTNMQARNAAAMLSSGKKLSEVAEHFGVDERTIRYNTNEDYKKAVLTKATGKHTGNTHMDVTNRADYKRWLVETRKKVIITE